MPEETTKPTAAKPVVKPKAAPKPKAHPTSPVHSMEDKAVVTVPVGILRKLGLASELGISDEAQPNVPTKCTVGQLRKHGFAAALPKAPAK